MRICIVGSGAREVAIARSLKASPKCSAVSSISFSLPDFPLARHLSVLMTGRRKEKDFDQRFSPPRSCLVKRLGMVNLQDRRSLCQRERHRPRA